MFMFAFIEKGMHKRHSFQWRHLFYVHFWRKAIKFTKFSSNERFFEMFEDLKGLLSCWIVIFRLHPRVLSHEHLVDLGMSWFALLVSTESSIVIWFQLVNDSATEHVSYIHWNGIQKTQFLRVSLCFAAHVTILWLWVRLFMDGTVVMDFDSTFA